MSNVDLVKRHKVKLFQNLSNYLDAWIARKALFLADEPRAVLDFPCKNGQYWPLLTAKRGRRIIAADVYSDRLTTAWNTHPTNIIERICLLHIQTFPIGLPDDSMDCIFSMSLHLPNAPFVRMSLLREFYRITRDSLIISISVERNTTVRPRQRSQMPPHPPHSQTLSSIEKVEAEFRVAGFSIQRYIIRPCSRGLRRTYILRKSGL